MKTHSVDEAAKLLVKMLQIGRRDGTISPSKLIKGRVIADRWNKKFPDDPVTDVDVRMWVDHARGVLGMPIYSERGQNGGYAWCETEDEWKRTKAHIMSSIKLQLAAASKPDAYFTHLNQGKVFEDGDHAGNGGTISTGNAPLDALLKEGGATLVQGDEEGLPSENRMD